MDAPNLIIKVSPEQAKLWRETCAHDGHLQGHPETIDTITNALSIGGVDYEIDLRLGNSSCDPGEGGGPYIDAVLFRNGNEVDASEPSDTLTGDYLFLVDTQTVLIRVVV